MTFLFRLFMVSATLLSLSGTLSAAWADTDYRCLNLCVGQGGSASKCMPQCSYTQGHATQSLGTSSLAGPAAFGAAKSPTIDKTAGGALSNHRVIPSRQLGSSDQILSTAKPVSPFSTSRNYACIAECTQAKMQYSTCESSCTTVTSKADQSVLSQPTAGSTNNALGVLNAAANPPAPAANPYAK